MKRLFASLLSMTVLAFTACKSHEKKLLVYASSDIQTDNSHLNITLSEGTTHHEQEFDFSGSEPVTLNIQSPSGKFSLTATEDGLYIANLKNDTIVGSYQHVGTGEGETKITQDALKQKLDSLQKLLRNENVSAGNRNYFIPPGKIMKITGETRAKVFGPFTTIPGSFDAGSVPEIYKFYDIQEIREIINKLAGMLAPPAPKDAKADSPDGGKK
jgi:hypothetical protein